MLVGEFIFTVSRAVPLIGFLQKHVVTRWTLRQGRGIAFGQQRRPQEKKIAGRALGAQDVTPRRGVRPGRDMGGRIPQARQEFVGIGDWLARLAMTSASTSRVSACKARKSSGVIS